MKLLFTREQVWNMSTVERSCWYEIMCEGMRTVRPTYDYVYFRTQASLIARVAFKQLFEPSDQYV